jgi:hypothetical protein
VERAADVGRLCVAPACRSVGHRVVWGLLGRTWMEMRAHGFTEAYGIVTPSMARMYRSWGLHVIHLGAKREYQRAARYPALIRPAESLFALVRTVERLRDRSGVGA